MKDIDKQKDFIRLRAKNLSLKKISDKINVSKTTLIKWNNEFKHEIDNLNRLELEGLYEEYKLTQKQRLEELGQIHKKVLKEIKSRDLKDVKTDTLLKMLISTMDKIGDLPHEISNPLTEDEIEYQKSRDEHWASLQLIP